MHNTKTLEATSRLAKSRDSVSPRSKAPPETRKVKKEQSSEHVVLDKFGRSMSVSPEATRILKRLPDLSFLSAKTLMYNPEHKQIVTDLGAVINRKMPG